MLQNYIKKMKEVRFFYVPDAINQTELPEEEAMHALRVLRLKSGDEMMLMDGEGAFYRAEVTLAATRRCLYKVLETINQDRPWKGYLRLVTAPTKMMDRMDWMVEKTTEIGVDEFNFVNCKFSERKVLRTVRLDKIVTAAMKQSRKAWKPQVEQMITFKQFMAIPRTGYKFIAHCYDEIEKTELFDELRNLNLKDEDVTILIGPEGDFSLDEVRMAVENGYKPISLGSSRLRTETAGLMAVSMFQLAQK